MADLLLVEGEAIVRTLDQTQAIIASRTSTVPDWVQEEMSAVVSKGWAWLDRVMPGWRSSIDAEQLDLGSACRCVLGQVGNGFYATLLAHGHASYIGGVIEPEWVWAAEHGFTLSLDWSESNGVNEKAYWQALTDTWAERIELANLLDGAASEAVLNLGDVTLK